MTFNFSNFASADISGRTAEYVIPGVIGSTPIIQCKPATQENRPYFNALQALFSTAEIQAYARSKQTSEASRRAWTTALRSILPRHVVSGWRGVLDASGAEVPYSPGAATALFEGEHLPDWIVQEIFSFASDRSNFFGASEPDVEGLAGNSPAA